MFGARKKRRVYSAEMRRDVLDMAEAGVGTRAIALEPNVSESRVRRVKQEFRETGKTAPKKTRDIKMCREPHAAWLAEKVAETPDIYLHELQRAAAEFPDRHDGTSLAPLLRDEPGAADALAGRVVITDSQRVAEPVMWRQSATVRGKWRLIDGRRLYDVATDPGQTENLLLDRPKIARELRQAYKAWRRSLRAELPPAARIVVGDDAANPVGLTAHDVHGMAVAPWNQQIAREGGGATEAGPVWKLRVARAGKYRVTLSRWPLELEAPLDAALPPAPEVPGERGYHASRGSRCRYAAAS